MDVERFPRHADVAADPDRLGSHCGCDEPTGPVTRRSWTVIDSCSSPTCSVIARSQSRLLFSSNSCFSDRNPGSVAERTYLPGAICWKGEASVGAARGLLRLFLRVLQGQGHTGDDRARRVVDRAASGWPEKFVRRETRPSAR